MRAILRRRAGRVKNQGAERYRVYTVSLLNDLHVVDRSPPKSYTPGMAERILGLVDEVRAFEQHLLEQCRANGTPRYTARTAHTYAVAVNPFVRDRRDFARALTEPAADAASGEATSRWMVRRSAMLAWASWKGDDGLAKRLRAIRLPPISYQDTHPPAKEEWDRIVAAAAASLSEPRRSSLLLLMVSGLRIGEVFLLTRRQVELGCVNREIAVWQKGSRTRSWSPSTPERTLLGNLARTPGWHTLRDSFDPLPPGPEPTERQRYDAAYHEVRKTLHAVCAAAGVDYVRPHRYRHAVSNDMMQTGSNLIDVQEALGHADSRTTDHFYLHSSAERQISNKDRAAAGHKRPF
jgi:integrase